MGLEGESDNRRELYNKFREQLASGADNIFYDEDELIEIYDQASDMEDENVKLHVLLVAYRLYPKSEEMAARRGYFLWTYRMDEGVEQLLKTHANSDALIWKLLALRSRSVTTPEELTKRLEDLIKTQTDIDDETMIQLVNLASESGAYQWLKDSEELLRSKTSYLPTLLYELHIVALNNNDRPFAIKKLEELTDLEPFVTDYWNLLSEELMNDGNMDASINAADYALAIDAANKDAIINRCRAIVCKDNADSAEAIEQIRPILEEDPTTSDSRALRIMVTALIQLNRNDQALALLKERAPYTIWDRGIIDYMMILHYPEISEVLETHYQLGENTSEQYWSDWALEMYSEGKYREAAAIFNTYSAHAKISEANFDIFITSLYLGKYYLVLTKLLDDAMNTADAPDGINPELALAGIFSLIRLGETERAKSHIEKLISALPGGVLSIGTILRNSGYFTLLQMLKRVIESNRISEIDTFDPFIDLSDSDSDH